MTELQHVNSSFWSSHTFKCPKCDKHYSVSTTLVIFEAPLSGQNYYYNKKNSIKLDDEHRPGGFLVRNCCSTQHFG